MAMKFVTFDFETTGLKPWDGCVIFSYSITQPNGATEVIRIEDDEVYFWKRLRDLWADNTTIKVIHNYKFELHFLIKHGVPIAENTIVHDTMIMSQMLNNLEPSHSQAYLSNAYCADPKLKQHWKYIDKIVETQFKERGSYQRIDRRIMDKYQVNDGIRCLLLYLMYLPKLQANKRLYTCYRHEIALIPPTQKMEQKGLKLSPANIYDLQKKLGLQLHGMQDEAFALYNRFVNFNSDDEIRELLYNDFDLPITKYTKKAELPATDKEVLLEIHHKHPDLRAHINLIIKYRSYSKGISMLDGYLSHMKSDHIINHSILTNHAKTGRQASRDPNTQNVSKSGALKNLFPVEARRAFIPHTNCWIYFVDYSGIEMRLIVDACKCEELMEFIISGVDVHMVAAEYWFGTMWSDQERCLKEFLPTRTDLYKQYRSDWCTHTLKGKVSTLSQIDGYYFKACRKLMRGASKNCAFGLAYGGGLAKLAQTVDMEISFLEPGYNAYCERFPEVKSFSGSRIAQVKRTGYVTTAFGRQLMVDKRKIYAGANAEIQGTAAEILKRATVKVDKYITPIDEVDILLPIHDELVFSVNDARAEDYNLFKNISNLMIDMPEISVPLEVEWQRTKTNWNETEDFNYIGV